ncbi:4-hydroxythreonine-4-phosphate dehydrogenase PdxA [Gammaproteobacteria bacterium]|nr:4-hydroxythreonine-4-phosphate dehydrogenase PdxA [Gammaproteobacteria bacterium]
MINKPTFVSLGDPSGIGPEVFIKAIKDQRLRQHLSKIILVSSPKVIEGAISALDVKQKINPISDVNEAQPDSVNLINIDGCQDFVLGKPTFNNSNFIIECLSTAADLALKNSSCLVTGPLNKSIIQKHIQNFTGHTEFLKEKFNANEVLMYMTNGNLHLGITTTHVPLRVVPNVISRDLIKNKYKLLHHGLIDIFKLANPKIAVLGINPHAGEFGTIGDEEQNVIMPAIDELQHEGYDANGPISADTVFTQTKYDAVLSMYHDQALPVLKTIDFHKTVNITLGLPFLRVSVDHGTAEDIAKDYSANYDSMMEALLISIARNEA